MTDQKVQEFVRRTPQFLKMFPDCVAKMFIKTKANWKSFIIHERDARLLFFFFLLVKL